MIIRRLYRSRKDRKIAGVIGGLAEYFGIDASLLRIIFVLLLIFTGFMPLVIVYLIAMILVPDEEL